MFTALSERGFNKGTVDTAWAFLVLCESELAGSFPGSVHPAVNEGVGWARHSSALTSKLTLTGKETRRYSDSQDKIKNTSAVFIEVQKRGSWKVKVVLSVFFPPFGSYCGSLECQQVLLD